MDRQEAEQRYVTGTISLSALAKEAGVTERTMQKWSSQGGWRKKREEFQARALRQGVNRAVNKRARELEKLILAAGTMEEVLIQAAEGLKKQRALDTEGDKVANGRFQAGNISSIANAIGRQIESRMILSGLLAPAEAERIKLLKKKQRLEEKQAAAREEIDSQGIRVTLEEDAEALSE